MLTIKILDVSDQPINWDAADALAEGWTTEQALQWAKEHAKILTSHDIEKARLEEEKRLMEEKKTPQENTPDSAPQITVASEQKPVIVSVPSEPQGNVIPMRAVEVREWMPPEFSEVDLALAWSADNPDWRYVNEWNKWYQWDGSRWAEDKKNSVVNIAQRKMVEAANWASAQNLSVSQKRAICSKKTIRSVIDLAGSIPKHSTCAAEWDNDPWILGTPDGVIDLKTGVIRPATRDDAITKLTKVSPQPGQMPTWESVLDRCTNGDEEMRRYYQKWAGYTATGSTKEEALLFIFGPQQSGKSKFIHAIADILGDYRAEASVETFMESKMQRHPEEVAAMAGARMITCTEPTAGMRWNEGLVKKITGRERMTASRKYEHQFEFDMTGKIWISGNDKPHLTNADGMERRLHIAEFPESIPDSEVLEDLPEMLEKEYPAILAWIIEGCLLWQQEGLKRPTKVSDAVKDYIDTQDILGDFLAERTEKADSDRIKQAELYKYYAEYVKSVGHGAVGNARLGPELKKRGYKQGKSSGVRYVYGVRMRTSFDPEPQQTSYMDKYNDKW